MDYVDSGYVDANTDADLQKKICSKLELCRRFLHTLSDVGYVDLSYLDTNTDVKNTE